MVIHQIPQLILASKSPRRQSLLKDAGFKFEIFTYDVDEAFSSDLKKEEVALYLSHKKAMAFPENLSNKILLTADTIVCLGDQILNKPENAEEAETMLNKLSGRSHEVITGICLRSDRKTNLFFEKTEVFFHPLSTEEIRYYIDNYHPFDKAGSYGIQDWIGNIGVKKINGCYYNVMGLPVSRLYRELSGFIREE